MARTAPAASRWRAFTHWFAKSPLASFLRAFTATVLTLAVANWTSAATVSFADWRAWVIPALAASLPVITRWINPQDSGFGAAGR
jgi:hypothetical protein